jgi:acyl carrier protein phosphodiesterase
VDVQKELSFIAIDTFTDAHPVLDTKTAFKTIIMLVIVDVFYDHFLAKSWRIQ